MLSFIRGALAVYAWAVIAVLLFFLWHIAGFYEQASGEQVGHRLLLLPGAFLAAGAVWYLIHDNGFVGEPTGDLLLFAGGILLLFFSSRLQRLMTGE